MIYDATSGFLTVHGGWSECNRSLLGIGECASSKLRFQRLTLSWPMLCLRQLVIRDLIPPVSSISSGGWHDATVMEIMEAGNKFRVSWADGDPVLVFLTCNNKLARGI